MRAHGRGCHCRGTADGDRSQGRGEGAASAPALTGWTLQTEAPWLSAGTFSGTELSLEVPLGSAQRRWPCLGGQGRSPLFEAWLSGSSCPCPGLDKTEKLNVFQNSCGCCRLSPGGTLGTASRRSKGPQAQCLNHGGQSGTSRPGPSVGTAPLQQQARPRSRHSPHTPGPSWEQSGSPASCLLPI